MAKPLNPYQGPAPAAMGMMGQGILEAGANIGRTLQGGYESMGKGIAGGINTAVGEYAKHKDDQAKFDATKKLFSAFEDYLPKQTNPDTGEVTSPMGDKIKSLLADTSMSVREKNQMAPMLFSFLGQAQQQAGRESVANIMTGSREAIAAAKNQPRPERPAFNAAPEVDPLDLPVGASPAAPQALQGPPAQPQPVQQFSGKKLPRVRQNPQTGKMEFLNPQGTRYIEEPDGDRMFGPDFRIQ